MTSIEQYLREIYYDPDSDVSYSDIKALWNRVKKDRAKHERIKYQDLKKWLTEQRTYTLHKALHKSFPTRKTYVPNIDDQFQADIVDMQSFERDNKGYRYILTVIPVKSKRGDDIFNAFETIFRERKPEKIQFDKGKEFYNRTVKDLLEKEGIEYFSTYSDKKAAIVERFNRTLKTRMWKYFTEKSSLTTRTWIPVLHKFVNSYNNTTHSTISMTPTSASKEENHNIPNL